MLGHCRTPDTRWIFCPCLASLRFLWLANCLVSAIQHTCTILLDSVDAICNDGRAHTESVPETGTRVLLKMFANQTGDKLKLHKLDDASSECAALLLNHFCS